MVTSRLNTIDQLFALLRVLTFTGGTAWIVLTPVPEIHQLYLIYNFIFFVGYSLILYLLIFLWPLQVRLIYSIVLLLDIVFITFLLKYTGGFESIFFLAYLLLIALHSFYFGLSFGIGVILLSIISYLIAGDLALNLDNILDISFRMIFFFIVGISMGLVSRKESTDKERIEHLNTELRQEKDKLSKILMGINAGLVLLNENRQIQWVNNIVKEWFDLDGKYMQKVCKDILWRNDELCRDCPTMICLEKGTIESTEIEHFFENKTGKFFRITAVPLYDEFGEVEKVLEVIQDISEEKEMQMNLVHASKLAAVGELASGVAHEINNPLSAIAICVKEIGRTLEDKILDNTSVQEMDQCLKSIRDEINRCKKITTGLLSIARKTTGKYALVDLNQLTRHIVALVKFKAESEQKKLTTNLSADLPMVTGAAEELSQVLLNLVFNALDFTPAGKSIHIKTFSGDDSFVCVQVTDEGYGISEENLKKIFDPFFTTKPNESGTGLGLTLSMKIIQNHRGRIKVESKLGAGTKIKVFLPLNQVQRN